MRSSNVLPFRSGGRPANNGWGVRLFAALFYLYSALMISMDPERGLTFLMVIALLYWIFLQRQLHRTGYFQKNAVLIVILALILLLIFQWQAISLVCLMGLYWLLIHRPVGEAPYFLRFHLVTGLILNLLILLATFILNATAQFVFHLLQWGAVQQFNAIAVGFNYYFPQLITLLIAGFAIYLAISALMGRTPYLPIVTRNVRPLA